MSWKITVLAGVVAVGTGFAGASAGFAETAPPPDSQGQGMMGGQQGQGMMGGSQGQDMMGMMNMMTQMSRMMDTCNRMMETATNKPAAPSKPPARNPG